MAHDRPPQPPSQGQSRVWVGTGVGQPHDWVMVEMCRQAGTMQVEHRTPVVVAVGQPVWMGGVTVTEAVGGVTVVSWTLLLPPSPRVFWAVARAAVLAKTTRCVDMSMLARLRRRVRVVDRMCIYM